MLCSTDEPVIEVQLLLQVFGPLRNEQLDHRALEPIGGRGDHVCLFYLYGAAARCTALSSSGSMTGVN